MSPSIVQDGGEDGSIGLFLLSPLGSPFDFDHLQLSSSNGYSHNHGLAPPAGAVMVI